MVTLTLHSAAELHFKKLRLIVVRLVKLIFFCVCVGPLSVLSSY